ncbi:methyltransferase domain-containing protein [Actinophytocola sp. S1-96]|uniref:Methyltransferase domain-containing protein n=2 Tax=Actinophytocola gossypii TaxID=2812003 RepID=A0ABT2J276_9PSEU|nr:methyltransferase domain-containing protein [Actinophytocola gossypii]
MIASDVGLHIGMWTLPGERKPASTLLELSNRSQERANDYHYETLGLTSTDHVLDIGCRSGGTAIQLARRSGGRATGIDVSRGQLAEAVASAQSAGISDRVSFQYGNAMALEFEDESFDAAVALEVFPHLSDRQRGYHEAFRVLRPGGHFLVSEFDLRNGKPSDEELNAFLQTWQIMPPTSPAKTLERAANAGFDLVKVEDMSQNVAFSGEGMAYLYADRRDDIVQAYGAEAADHMDHVMPLIRSFFNHHLGSHLYLLRKPRKA